MPAYRYLFLSLLLHAIWPLHAQDIFSRYTRYTTRDGLSHPYISCLAKDEDGFLWIGTREGLCRFDGDRFEILLKNSSSNSISNNQVNCVAVLNNHLLFAGTAYGLNIINTKTLEVKNVYFNGPAVAKEKTNSIVSLVPNPKGGMWVNLYNGIALVDSNGNVEKQILLSANTDSLANTALQKIVYIEPNGTPVCINNYYRFVKPDFKAREFINDNSLLAGTILEKIEQRNTLISSISNTPDGKVYIVFNDRRYWTTPGQIMQLDPVKHTSRLFSPQNNETDKRLYQVTDVNDSLLLVTAYFGGPVFFNKHTGTSATCTQPPGFFSSWPDGQGNCFLKDGNNLWIGSNKELYQIKLGAAAIEPVPLIDSILNKQLSLVNVGDAIPSGNKLIITCMGSGILIFDRKNGKGKLYTYKVSESRYSISSFSFLKSDDTVWNASNYGLTYINLKTGNTGLIQNPSKPGRLDRETGKSFVDHNGNFWCTHFEKIFCYIKTTQVFEDIKIPTDSAGRPLMETIGDIAEDSRGDLYFGSARKNGIFKYDPAQKKWETFLNSFEYKDFSSGQVRGMVIDKNNMYLCLRGAFAELNLQTKVYRIYTKIDGLSTTGINAIAVDKNGYVWIATSNGLNCFDPYLKKFTTYYTADGLAADYISSVGMIDPEINLMYIGTEKTFRLFKPDLLLGEKAPPIIIITSIKNAQGDKLKTPEGKLDLLYNNNDIEIEYTGINFNNGTQNKYAYRLKGKDSDWIEAGSKKSATYTNLPPGDYVFEVKSANRQGIWNDVPAMLSIVIKPPFWRTLWFYIVSVFFVAGFILLIFYSQHLSAKKRETEKIRINDQLNELRMKALRSQLNPHFIFNALNSIQSYVMDNNTVEASRYLSKFAKLFRLVLDNTDANFTTLQKEINLLSNYIELEALRFNHSFSFEIKVDDNIHTEKTNIPSMLLQPHIENAILHGLSTRKNGRLLIDFTRNDENSITCTITDNGIGRRKAETFKKGKFQTHESRGITILEQRAQLLRSQYNLQSSYFIKDLEETEPETGTMVIVVLPVQNGFATPLNEEKQ